MHGIDQRTPFGSLCLDIIQVRRGGLELSYSAHPATCKVVGSRARSYIPKDTARLLVYLEAEGNYLLSGAEETLTISRA